MYLGEHETEIAVHRALKSNKFAVARAMAILPDAKLLLRDISLQEAELQNTFHLAGRVQGGTVLTMPMQAMLVAFS